MSVWALTDDRAGHTAHSIGLAQSLDVPFAEKKLDFNKQSILPDWALGASLKSLKNASLISPPWPRMVIAAGRRMVPVMRYIKEQSAETVLVQSLWPGRLDPFDLILAPEHDELPEDDRIIRFKGALHSLTPQKLQDARFTFQSWFDEYPKPHLGVLIGGHSAHGKATLDDLHHLIDTAELLAGDGTLFITTSRRTPPSFAKDIRDRLTGSYTLYEWNSEGTNPYLGILAHADAILVSGDSISMIAESCFTGKPVLIDTGFHSIRAKHLRCAESLFAGNHAFPLRADTDLTTLQPASLDPWPAIHGRLKDYLKNA